MFRIDFKMLLCDFILAVFLLYNKFTGYKTSIGVCNLVPINLK